VGKSFKYFLNPATEAASWERKHRSCDRSLYSFEEYDTDSCETQFEILKYLDRKRSGYLVCVKCYHGLEEHREIGQLECHTQDQRRECTNYLGYPAGVFALTIPQQTISPQATNFWRSFDSMPKIFTLVTST